MAVRYTQIAAEVLRSSSKAVYGSGSTAVTFFFTASQARNVPASASTLIVASLSATQRRDGIASAYAAMTFHATCSQVRDAVSSGSSSMALSLADSTGKVASSDAGGSVGFSAAASGVVVRNASGETGFTLSQEPSQVRDIRPSGSSSFSFYYLASEHFQAGGAMALTSVAISSDASAVKDAIGSASTTITASDSSAGNLDHLRSASDSLSLSGAARAPIVVNCVAVTNFTIHQRAAGQQSSIGGNPMASQYVGYLGQYQLGQVLPLVLRAVGYQGRIVTPDGYPTATIYDDSGASQTFRMPAIDRANAIFSLPLHLGLTFALGRYRVSYRYSTGGEARARVDYFEVIPGGDPGGAVISIFACDRPEAGYVLAQLGSGKLVQGRNPRI